MCLFALLLSSCGINSLNRKVLFVCWFDVLSSVVSYFLVDFNNTVNLSYKIEASHEANGASHQEKQKHLKKDFTCEKNTHKNLHTYNNTYHDQRVAEV